jgi:hypothetical protein
MRLLKDKPTSLEVFEVLCNVGFGLWLGFIILTFVYPYVL